MLLEHCGETKSFDSKLMKDS
uniref:Uncharacterized protein n=1 Tax=Rhizophora mucronata TaxID=61149 RepID=A0A2P2PFI2_RHIMU